ncbi:MAG TPA: glutamyl-tRNA reductase [Longimicrobiales bacterium]
MLTLIGTSHRSTAVAARERFAFDAAEAEAAMRQIVARGWADEAILLSTCNRTELYVYGENVDEERLLNLLAAHAGFEVIEAQQYLEIKTGTDCVQHLYRVTAGMDSLVVGEAQIQGQVRNALESATQLSDGRRVVGPQLARLFQGALAIGGRIRSETELGAGAASVPGAAVALARKVLGKLDGKRVLVIGAGHMSALVLKHLSDDEPRQITVASRTRDSAEHVAQRFGARAAGMNELELLLASHDLLITATSCPNTIINPDTVRSARAHLRDSLCIVDIAVPRDTDAAVGNLPNVFLFDVDDLSQIVDENLARRRAHWPHAEKLVAAAVSEYQKWHEARTAVPLIRKLRADAETVRRAELERALKGLEHLTPGDRERIEVLTQQLINKVLHRPTVRLREAAGTHQKEAVLEAASFLFE